MPAVGEIVAVTWKQANSKGAKMGRAHRWGFEAEKVTLVK
jgi:hypothetical protein